MDLHMHCTGAYNYPDFEAAEAYVRARVDRWQASANGPRWAAFDTAVLSLCIATLVECDRHVRPVQATLHDPAADIAAETCQCAPHYAYCPLHPGSE